MIVLKIIKKCLGVPIILKQILFHRIHLLAKISDQEIIRSRQHFLKIQFPYTYRNLMHLGIKEEYSLGYADQIGFRASIANPFRFFDLESNKLTDLSVYPFQVMDATFRYNLKSKQQETIELNKQIVSEVAKVNGTFISIWHNESLSNKGSWKKWRDVYEKLLEECYKYSNSELNEYENVALKKEVSEI